jgi:hypothetical protein
MDQYKGYVVSDINANTDTVEFTNGVTLTAGEAYGDINKDVRRRIQIRETIKAHLDKEEHLFKLGIKALSLFFIDEVVKYRDYDAENNKGLYAVAVIIMSLYLLRSDRRHLHRYFLFFQILICSGYQPFCLFYQSRSNLGELPVPG